MGCTSMAIIHCTQKEGFKWSILKLNSTTFIEKHVEKLFQTFLPENLGWKGHWVFFRLFSVCAEISSLRPCKILQGKFKAHDPVYRNLDVRQQMLGVLPLKHGILVSWLVEIKVSLECWWMFVFFIFQAWTVQCICALVGTNYVLLSAKTPSSYQHSNVKLITIVHFAWNKIKMFEHLR